jgi:hypothetical protein
MPRNKGLKKERINGASPQGMGDPGAKVRLVKLDDLDKRTGAYREVASLIDEIESELGGRDRLSSARRQVIEAGALATAMRRDLGVRWLNGEKVDVSECRVEYTPGQLSHCARSHAARGNHR